MQHSPAVVQAVLVMSGRDTLTKAMLVADAVDRSATFWNYSTPSAMTD